MAITVLPQGSNASVASAHEASKAKIISVVFLFLLSLLTFVTQTEFTSQAYQLGFKEPIILLLVTHGSWWILWPLQVLAISIWRTLRKVKSQHQARTATYVTLGDDPTNIQYQRLNSASQLMEHNQPPFTTSQSDVPVTTKPVNYITYFKKCVVKQFHNVYHTSILVYEANVNDDKSTDNLNHLIDQNPRVSNSSSITDCVTTFVATPAIRYIFGKTLMIAVILTIAGSTWYGAMSLTYASDVTAIYNCSAFTAYAFAIPLLNEKFSWLKASSVVIAIAGVFIVAYSGTDSVPKTDGDKPLYPYRFWGNLIILIGAILYGYYEVLYKKYTCIPDHLSKVITPRRQMTFANFIMGLFGIYTFIILSLGILLAQVFHIHNFTYFDYGENTTTIWLYVFGSIVSNLSFSALFLSLMALTSPVLSSVSSLLTIFLIGVVEWLFFGNKLGFQQLLGDLFVVIGFTILTAASWKEISEGNEDDDVETVSTYSFAVSTDGS